MNTHTNTVNNIFVFREAANADELLALLKLRYEVYRNSRVSGFVEENEFGIDLDAYDLRARHFGLFQANDSGGVPVGYLRVVEDRITSSAQTVLRIARDTIGKTNKIMANPLNPFPLMDHYPGAKVLHREYRRLETKGKRMVEAGRLALSDDFRSLRVACHIIESALTIYFIHHRFEHAIWCCYASCSGFYSRLYGLKKHITGGYPEFTKFGRKSNCLIGQPAWLPGKIRGKLEAMADMFGRVGYIPYPFTVAESTTLESMPAVA